MTSNSYKDFHQTEFNGGIETREEFLKKNQLLDAANYWYPQGELEQRPGAAARRFRGGLVSNLGAQDVTTTLRVTPASAATKANPGGGTASVITPGVSNLNAFLFGDAMVLHYNGFPPGEEMVRAREISLRNASVNNAVTKTRALLQAWTSRGWVDCWCQLNSNAIPSLQPFALNTQRLSFAAPDDILEDTITFTTGALTGYFLRLIFVSATDTTGSPFTSGIIYGNAGFESRIVFNSDVVVSGLNPATRPLFPGAWFVKYASGNRFISYFLTPERTGLSPAYTNMPRLEVFTSNSIQRTTLLDPGVSTEPARYDYRYKTPRQPPSIAVIPEFNTAFIAYCNLLLEQKYAGPWSQTDVYPSGSTFGPLVAAVNTDPLIVGALSTSNPTAPYPADQIPQLTAFPPANLIVYFKNQLFASGILGDPTLIRWSGSANDSAYNVWPEDNQVNLSTAQDNSEITGMAALGDNFIVFKKNSIWALIDNGLSDLDLPLYEPRLVVAGVGTVSHHSIQPLNGGLLFLAEDGFYFFDGTPNIRRISDPVKSYVDQINPARTSFAVSTLWRTKQTYICACSSRGEDQANDLIFVYDYQNNAWYIWSGWNVQCWLQVDGVGLQEELWFTDSYGRAFQLERWTQSDNGAYIDSWLLTGRYGFGEIFTKTSKELRVWGINNNPEVTYSVIGDDIEINVAGSSVVDPVTYPITMPREEEQRWDDTANLPVSGESTWVPRRQRARKSTNRTVAQWFQVKVYKMLKVFGLALGFEDEARR